jgi:hypothetical protein
MQYQGKHTKAIVMFKAFVIVFTLILFIGCNGSDDSPQTSTSTELEGTWYGEERDTNVTTIIEMNGGSFSYASDPQLSTESYSGSFTITDSGNPGKMALRITSASEPAAVGETGLCLYSIDGAEENIVLACNGPGNPNYPAGFTPTNETRVWDFSKQPATTSAINLIGTWESACLSDGTLAAVDEWEFMINGDVTRTLHAYADITCSGTPVNVTFTGTYSIGASLTTPGGYTAYELDALLESNSNDSTTGTVPAPNTQSYLYTIAHIDDSGTLFFGESIDQPGGSSSQDTRPDSIDFNNPYQRQ